MKEFMLSMYVCIAIATMGMYVCFVRACVRTTLCLMSVYVCLSGHLTVGTRPVVQRDGGGAELAAEGLNA
jgi:hypothetical protein